MAIDKSILGVAGELAVAAELCRRNIYAQLTFGHQKRTDLLVFSETGGMFRIEVKSKQGREWPNCKGIWAQNSFIVFVDFAGKDETVRPDFYILTAQDWHALALTEMKRYLTKHPDRHVEITKQNVLVLADECNASGKPYQGFGVRTDYIQGHKEAWGKFRQAARA